MNPLRRFLASVARKAYTSLSAVDWSRTRRELGGQERANNPYAQNAWVYAGATNKARALVAAPLIAVEGSRVDEVGTQLASTDALARLLATPQVAPPVTAEEFVMGVSVDLDVTGNAFALMRGLDGRPWTPGPTPPAQLVPVHPSRVTYLPTDVVDRMTGALRVWRITDLFGLQYEVPAESVLHWKYRNPLDPIAGLAPLMAAALGIQSEWSADQFLTSMLRNGCSPGAIIEQTGSEDLNPEERNFVLSQFKDDSRGPAKAGSAVLMPKGFKVTMAGASPRDMEMPAQRNWSRSQIRAVLGCTEFELGEIADQNRANADAARAWLWTNTLVPTSRYIEAVLWTGLFRHLSRNAARDVWARFDLDKVQALKGASVETATAISTLTMAGFEPGAVAKKFGLDLPVAADVGGVIDVAGSSQVVGAQPSGPAILIGKAAPRRMTDREALRTHERFLAQAEALVARKVRAVFADRWKAARRALELGRKDAAPPTAEELARAMGSAEDWARAMREGMGDSFLRIGAAALKGAKGELGGFQVVKLDDPAWRALADKRVAALVRVGVKTRARLAETIAGSLADAEGYSVARLADEIDAKFGTAIQSNGMVIARTESAMHGNAVRHEAFKAEGVEQKVWRAARDEHTRDSHRRVNGETVPYDAKFSNGMLHPGDPLGGAKEVIQCRCVARPRFAG